MATTLSARGQSESFARTLDPLLAARVTHKHTQRLLTQICTGLVTESPLGRFWGHRLRVTGCVLSTSPSLKGTWPRWECAREPQTTSPESSAVALTSLCETRTSTRRPTRRGSSECSTVLTRSSLQPPDGIRTHDLFLEREGAKKRDLATKTLGSDAPDRPECTSEKGPYEVG